MPDVFLKGVARSRPSPCAAGGADVQGAAGPLDEQAQVECLDAAGSQARPLAPAELGKRGLTFPRRIEPWIERKRRWIRPPCRSTAKSQAAFDLFSTGLAKRRG